MRGEKRTGPFTEQELQESLDAGESAPGDLCWREGMERWEPLSRAIGVSAGPEPVAQLSPPQVSSPQIAKPAPVPHVADVQASPSPTSTVAKEPPAAVEPLELPPLPPEEVPREEGYYYLDASRTPVGPLGREGLDRLLREGEITPATLASRKGDPTWVPVSKLAGRSIAAKPTPSAVPTPTSATASAEVAVAPMQNIQRVAEQPPSPSSSAINWRPALVLACAVTAVGIVISLVGLVDEEASEALSLWALPFNVLGVVVVCMLHHQCWKALPDRLRATTPGKAVGYLFIPLYNFYWAFVSWPKLAEGLAEWQKSLGKPALPEVRSLAMTCAILFVCSMTVGLIPGLDILIGIAGLVTFILLYRQIVTAINNIKHVKSLE